MIKLLEMDVKNVVEQNTFGDQRICIGSDTGKVGYFVLLSTDLTLLLADTRYGVYNVNWHKTFPKNTTQFGKK
jgi:hypothetical protein